MPKPPKPGASSGPVCVPCLYNEDAIKEMKGNNIVLSQFLERIKKGKTKIKSIWP